MSDSKRPKNDDYKLERRSYNSEKRNFKNYLENYKYGLDEDSDDDIIQEDKEK